MPSGVRMVLSQQDSSAATREDSSAACMGDGERGDTADS